MAVRPRDFAPDDRDRLFYYDKRLSAGARFNLNRSVILDLSGGYVFDRFYFEGRSLSDQHHDRIDVGDGPVVSFQGVVRW